MTQGIEKQVLSLAAIETECHFVTVGREMLCADTVPRSDDATLEQRECRLNRVGVDVAVNVHARAMVDSAMLIFHVVNRCGSLVRSEFVSDERFDVFTDVHSDIARESASGHV